MAAVVTEETEAPVKKKRKKRWKPEFEYLSNGEKVDTVPLWVAQALDDHDVINAGSYEWIRTIKNCRRTTGADRRDKNIY